MMFNGLFVCGDSDTSDFAKESIGASSGTGSGVSDGTGASEHCATDCLQSKLLSTMRILENKEETIRVQAQSLAVAQQRIAALTERAEYYRRQLDQSQQSPRCPDPRPVHTADMCINTDMHQEEMCQKKIVSTLRDNLSVIEELYRECFYETAKQEELIDLLRKSCADVKSMERHKSEQIGHLQHVVHSQKWSLDKCQDIATEVETLKAEISNFLNNSNHDSGMWEAQGVQGVQGVRGEELAADVQQVAAQLLRLRDLLAQSDCICGLKEENIKLRQRNEELEVTDKELRRRVQELEKALQDKNKENEKFEQQLDVKEREGRHMAQQVTVLRQKYMDQVTTCESHTAQLQHCQASLTSKCGELEQLQREVAELRERLSTAQLAAQQEGEVREEVRVLSRAVCAWRSQLATCQQRMRRLEVELQQAREHCDHLAEHYREKEGSVVRLQQELEEAHGRGAALCGETRALVAGLRCWLRRHRERIREQEDKISEQDELIRALQLSSRGAAAGPGEERPCCSRARRPAAEEAGRDDGAAARGSERSACNECDVLQQTSSARAAEVQHYSEYCRAEGQRGPRRDPTSGSETTNRSFPPKPPRRVLKKKRPPSNADCNWLRCEVAVQRPVRCDATTDGSSAQCASPASPASPARRLRSASCGRDTSSLCHCWPTSERNREVSAAEELLERVEGARHALHDAHARWRSHTDTSARAHRHRH
ncbi:golgin subfamily A member 6-like protein 1 [Papilio machaon]|uniref:golgin subfamily A member 6-like protein 1 n=1 Tax=Papilio machaon TaxID=76193 RepID=UPI001E664D0B|nr:golgin subfamily A member 6-like protein 1 [Papilio machaon]